MLGIELKDVRAFRETFEEGLAEGEEQGALKTYREILLESLSEEFGSLSEKNRSAVAALTLPQLKQLRPALKKFETEKDLKNWLKNN